VERKKRKTSYITGFALERRAKASHDRVDREKTHQLTLAVFIATSFSVFLNYLQLEPVQRVENTQKILRTRAEVFPLGGGKKNKKKCTETVKKRLRNSKKCVFFFFLCFS